MEKVAWEFYTKRTGRPLESILNSVYNVDEAKSIIDNMGLTLPSDEVLHAVIDSNIEKRAEKKRKAEQALIVKSKPTSPKRSQKKTRSTTKKATSKKTSASKKSKTAELQDSIQEKPKNEKYFRRVIDSKGGKTS